MTFTFNQEKYKELLTTYVPKLIKNEAENEQALSVVESLMHRERTLEENELYQLLITLIEKFEQENYHFHDTPSNPKSFLSFLFEQSNKSKKDLQAFLGTDTVLDEILEGTQNITLEHAQKLGAFFHVEPSLFLE
jgi:HTH-type transcriptional regulator / antitoxin HigA